MTGGDLAELVGRAVLVAHGGALEPRWVAAVEGGRLVTRGADGATWVLRPDRLYYATDRRLDGPAALAGWWDGVRERAASCDLDTAWEALSETRRGGSEPIFPAALAALTPGGEAPEDAAAAMLAVFDDGLRFKLRHGRLQVAARAAVEAALRAREEARRAAWELEQASGVLRARLVGEAPPPSDDPGGTRVAVGRHLTALMDCAVVGKDSSYAALAQQLLAALDRTTGELEHRAFAALVDLGELSRHENLSLRRHEVRQRFPRAVLEEAAELATRAPRVSARARDLSTLLTVAIDDAQTTEVDDAFALDGDRLCVFVADVASRVARGGRVDEEAGKRVTTLYLPEGKLPMIPEALGEGVLSLTTAEARPALCFSGVVDAEGRLTDFRVEEAWCRLDRRLTYDEVDARLGAADASPGNEADPVWALVRRVAASMRRHEARRTADGALTFLRQEVYLDVDAQHRVTFLRSNPNGPARQLVAELMVSACAATARLCRDEGIPCVYRSQPPPDKLPKGLPDRVTDLVEQAALLRKFKPTVLTTRPIPHFSLGVDVYTQVTSPIRRYQDLLMHHQLKGWLTTGEPPLSEQALLEHFDHLERRAGAHRLAEQESRRYWTLWALEQQPELVLEGVVLRPTGRRWVLRVPDYALQVTLSGRRKLSPGQRVRLRIDEVDARRDVLVVSEAR